MQFSSFLLLLLFVAANAAENKKRKENLPPDAQLRIGVKHRAETCDRKTKVSKLKWLHCKPQVKRASTPIPLTSIP